MIQLILSIVHWRPLKSVIFCQILIICRFITLWSTSRGNAKLFWYQNAAKLCGLGHFLTVRMFCSSRQMMIIAGGEPELCRRRHVKWEGGVYACPYALRVCKFCQECGVHVLCLCRKVWKRAWPARKTDVRETQGYMATPTTKQLYLCRKVWKRACVKWPVRQTDIRETQGCMATPTRKPKCEEVHSSLSCSSLAVYCVGASAFRFPIVGVLSLVAITTTHYTVRMCYG